MHKQFSVITTLRPKSTSVLGRCLLVVALCGLVNNLAAEESLRGQATYKVAIIIDDLGHNLHQGRALINLPYQLTYSILPNRPYSKRLANMAAVSGKEVMVHLPMQSARHSALGAGALTLEQTQKEFQRSVQGSIDSVPHARGVNNHMGSLLTQHPGHMAWLMEVLSTRPDNLYFVDSKTTAQTVATRIAHEHTIPTIMRDVFLDNSRQEQDIQQQLERLIRVAQHQGYAVAIGHPYPETISQLEGYLPTLLAYNIEVVPVTTLINHHSRTQRWAALSTGHAEESGR